MYIGGTDTKGYHHLLWEIVDNSVDEVINGYATHIEVTLHKDHRSATVVDNGRGIPVDVKKEFKKSALELVLTTLHAGGSSPRGSISIPAACTAWARRWSMRCLRRWWRACGATVSSGSRATRGAWRPAS